RLFRSQADAPLSRSTALITRHPTAPRSFFQAEACIRDWSVTGVQTCALPIYDRDRGAGAKEEVRDRLPVHEPLDDSLHDRGLRRGEDLTGVARSLLPELEHP